MSRGCERPAAFPCCKKLQAQRGTAIGAGSADDMHLSFPSVAPRSISLSELGVSFVKRCRAQTDSKHRVGLLMILLGSNVPSQYDFHNIHSHGGGKLRGKFQRLMFALPSIFPSKTTHRCTEAGEVRVNMKGCVL